MLSLVLCGTQSLENTHNLPGNQHTTPVKPFPSRIVVHFSCPPLAAATSSRGTTDGLFHNTDGVSKWIRAKVCSDDALRALDPDLVASLALEPEQATPSAWSFSDEGRSWVWLRRFGH